MKKQSSDTSDLFQRKTPEELKSKTEKIPLSCRVNVETRKVLEREAKKTKTSISDLAAGILDDYVHWLTNANNKEHRG